MNIQNRPTFVKNNDLKSVSNETQKIILSIGKALLLVIILMIIVYILYSTYKYYSIICDKKIPLYQYLTNFGNQSLCIINPIVLQEVDDNNSNTHTLSLEKGEKKSGMNDEVFQISNQMYTYDEAKCKCESYDGRLASKNELTQAYNNGAHWCNYGWIEGNEAYYPVQQCELDRKAKNIKEYNDILKNHHDDPQKYTLQMVNEARQKMYRENSLDFCGKNAGLNGGKFEDKNIRFGATCIGKKPDGMSVREKDAKCKDNILAKDVEKIHKEENKSKCGGISKSKDDVISSFNYDNWNKQ
jgi:hypothetical protein